MPDAKLRIWCNQSMPEDARRRLEQHAEPHHDLHFAEESNASNLAYGRPDPVARESDIAFGQPHVDDVMASRRLKWVHLSTAGYTRYDRDDVRHALGARGAIMTSSSAVFADACAQHALAMMLSLSRRLPQALAEQSARRWTYSPLREDSRVLSGQSALIVGFGGIGRRLVELLVPFRMTVRAVRRSVRGDEPVPTLTMDAIGQALPDSDHVVNLLPSAAATRHFFDERRLAQMKQGVFFYNIGRGDTVEQTALLAALASRKAGGAYLDVTDPEPLPPDHPLWTAPNCVITPHTAGGQQHEYLHLVNHFLDNLARLARGQALRDRVM